MDWLLSLYIGTSIFGVGVTAIDLLGLLGGDDEQGDETDLAELGADTGDGTAEGDLADGTEDGEGSIAGHDVRRRSPVIAIMQGARSLVYFSLGFGPVGWFGLGTGLGAIASLGWSVPVGVVVMVGARGLRRILRSELSSEISDADLIMEPGTVTVTIAPGQLGRVRITIGGIYVDRYARIEHQTEPAAPGTPIRVVSTTDECVFVEIDP